jgi:hypothetical protein
MTKQQVIDEAMKLPAEERFEVADALLSTEADGEFGIQISSEFAVELEQRYQDALKHPELLISLDEVERRLDAELGS